MAAKQPAHRPSRRDDIIDAAISVFARKGFVDASLADVADAASVAVTAVYYHFAGKDDLYGAAIIKVLSMIDDVVLTTRPDDAEIDDTSLDRVIDAVWEWVDDNPEPATLVYLHAPNATRQVAARRHAFDQLHADRAFQYVTSGRAAAADARRRAGAVLALRALIDMQMAIHPLRLPGGVLSGHSPTALRAGVKAVSRRIIAAV